MSDVNDQVADAIAVALINASVGMTDEENGRALALLAKINALVTDQSTIVVADVICFLCTDFAMKLAANTKHANRETSIEGVTRAVRHFMLATTQPAQRPSIH